MVLVEPQPAISQRLRSVPMDFNFDRAIVGSETNQQAPVILGRETVRDLHLSHLPNPPAVLRVTHEHLSADGFTADLLSVPFYGQPDPLITSPARPILLLHRVPL